MKRLEGQIAIVTGGSSGIGAGIAKELAAEGATVVVNYPTEKSKSMAEAVLADITSAGNKGIIFQCDVSKEDDVRKMFSDVVTKFGTVEILINNAGLQKDAAFVDMTLDDWNLVISVNLTGQFLCAREAIREFIRRGKNARSSSMGKIICISSVHEVIPWAGHANYAASKGGINMLMKTIAQEHAPLGIRINSIAPGAIQTPINRGAWDTPEHLQNLMKLIPQKRIGTPEDIAKASVWLASDESDYVNGATLFVDGGMTLYPGFTTNG